MNEGKTYLDTLLGTLGNTFQKKEDHIFKGAFLLIAGIFIFEITKWIYSHLDLSKMLAILGALFVAFVLRKHFGENTKKSVVVETLSKYKDRIMYSFFICFFMLLILGFALPGENGLLYITYFLLGSYIVMKFLGFKIGWAINKISYKSENSIYLCVIGACFIYIVTNYLLEVYDAGTLKALVYVGTFIVYVAGYLYLFTDFTGVFIGKVNAISSGEKNVTRRRNRNIANSNFLARNIYPVLSIFVILALVGFSYFQSENNGSVGDDTIIVETETKQDIQNEIPEVIEQQIEPEYRVAIKKVSELYQFNNRLEVGSEGDEVQKLQGFLASKGYYTGELDGIFDEETRVGLRNTLIGECDWPDTTFGVLGTQASACINNMEVEHKVLVNTSNIQAETPEVIPPAEEASQNTSEAQADEGVSEEIAELFIGDTGDSVVALQNTLIGLGYLASQADGNFDLTTSLALKSALIDRCDFSEETEGNYDRDAIACITSLSQ